MNRWKKSEKETPPYLCTHSEIRKEIQIIKTEISEVDKTYKKGLYADEC